ncbi:radical SAM protein [Bacillota bacterium]
MRSFEIGPIRPPSEAESLLLRVTRGCTWNRCKFCSLYRQTTFRAYPVEEVKQTIDAIAEYRERILSGRYPDGRLSYKAMQEDMGGLKEEEQGCYYMVYNWLNGGGYSVFLQDGNTMALAPERLATILQYLKEKIPGITRITSYGRAESLAKITVEQYAELKKAGLTRIHSGFESGSDRVLTLINKGVTAAEEIEAGRRIKASGIELSVYFMPGVGGKELTEENALETARVITAIDPQFVRLRTSVIQKRSELFEEVASGRLVPCTDLEKVLEIRSLIENIQGCGGYLASDHIINLLQDVEGRLDTEREDMLATIDQFLNLPEEERKLFQLARRTGRVTSVSDLRLLDPRVRRQLREVSLSVTDPEEWEVLLNRYLTRYI